MNLKNLRIVVDEREKKSGIPDLLKGTGINLEIKTLPVGDYIVAPETIVERKTVSDLVSSIFDGRLFDQCHRLKEHYQFPILIIEGDIDEIEELTENPLVFYGAISSIAIDFKIPVIPTPNAIHTSKLLISMCSRKDASKGPFIKKIRKSNDLQKQQLSMLCSLPGVGEKTAIRMLEKFGTPLRVLSSSIIELSKVSGLGEARAKNIKKVLQAQSKHLKKISQKTLHDT
ncbi:heavy metal resistance protein CzcA [Marine Group I thaumarchaeote]|uniref:Heavy metal resistance protein CzcA n=1 Tax=Marine Group I thaumarchaeote TaxID=2511932 RepID=A0A7K4ND42_9ARCH|nr:heavy metal resistance protein CzcA [Marine Group I thaumarchaeote]NWJ99223.1 heavy metal resistance protein CzcA [Marine Group I thaumarchaeote]NWJ99934.1 heavy metal resistance protein CzcA [Marine Group I thaumarchaeote]